MAPVHLDQSHILMNRQVLLNRRDLSIGEKLDPLIVLFG